MVTPYALLLFGGQIRVDHQHALLIVDEWIRFKAPARIAVLVKGLRSELDHLLSDKLDNPNLAIETHPVVDAMLQLVVSHGM